MAFNYSPKIVTDGLVLCLDAANTRSYVSGSTTWSDLSRSGNNGTLTNSPTFNSANGGSIVFDGTNDFVSTTYNAVLTNFTFCAWFRQSGSVISYQRIVDKNYITGFWVGRNGTTPNSWGGGVIEPNPPFGRYITLTDGQWHYIVSRRQGTTHTIYGDGITNTISGTVSSNALDTSQLIIGRELLTTALLNGNIAQTSIYNRALSESEILQNYNATKTRYGL
jgi:hypothetical protein